MNMPGIRLFIIVHPYLPTVVMIGRDCFPRCVNGSLPGPFFETSFAILIMINTIFMALAPWHSIAVD